MTNNDILTQVAQRSGAAGSVTPAQTARRLASLSNRQRQILTKIPKLRDSNITLTTVSGQQQYSLPPVVYKVWDIYDPRTNMRKLTSKTMDWVRSLNPQAEFVSFGSPSVWVDMGYRAQWKPLANASRLFVSSTSAADSQNATVEFIRTGGYQSSATVTLTGNTATSVQVGAYTDITEVTKFYLSNAAAGFVSVTSNTLSGTVASIISPGYTFARFKTILLWSTPNSSNVVLSMDCTRNVPDATAAINDEPLIPLDFQWVLIEGILMDECFKMDDTRYTVAKNAWDQGVRDLENDVFNTDDLIIIPGGSPSQFFPYTIPATGTAWP